jgi:hypothetical protein
MEAWARAPNAAAAVSAVIGSCTAKRSDARARALRLDDGVLGWGALRVPELTLLVSQMLRQLRRHEYETSVAPMNRLLG